MAFDISQIKLPEINIKGAFDDLGEKLKTNFQKIPTFNPDFDAADLQPLLLSKIKESNLPHFMKLPAELGVRLAAEDSEDVIKKREIWQEIKRIHPEKVDQIEQIENMPASFAMIGKDTLEELPEDLRKSAQKYADTQLMDIGFSVGSVERAGQKAALSLLKGVKAKFGSVFQKNADELLEEIPKASKRVVSYETAKDILEETYQKYLSDPENPIFKDETKRLFRKVGELLGTEEVKPEQLQEIFKKYNLDPKSFAQVYMDSVSFGGRLLGEHGRLSRKIKAAFPETEEILAQVPIKDPGTASKVWDQFRKLESTRRGLLVTQLATTSRNIISQSGRFTLQFFDDVFSGGMEALSGKATPKQAFIPAMEDVMSVFRQFSPKKREMLANTIDQFPFEKLRLFGTPVGDLYFGSKMTSFLNSANTAQEFFFRKMRMDALINSHFQRGGGPITQELMESWVDDALTLTFAKAPTKGFPGGFYKAITNEYINPIVTALGQPFPRFHMNALKFLWDFSPAGGMSSLVSPKFWKQLVSDNPREAYSALSKATMGTMMLAGALAVRNSDVGGEKWYELNLPNGKTMDTRAFAPFSTYLFLAEVLRQAAGEKTNLTPMDYGQAFLSINRIAGTGLVIVDALRAKNPETFTELVSDFAGAYISGFTVPFRTLKDFIAQGDPQEQVYRDTEQAPLLGPALENIPFATRGFPTAPRPTREEPFIREDPALRQLTGVTLKTKTDLEHEVDRLGLEYSTLYPRTGEDQLDRMITRRVGKVMDAVGNQIVNSPEYQKLDDNAKKEFMKELYSKTKSASKSISLVQDAPVIAASIYEQTKGLTDEEVVELFTRLRAKGLMKEEVFNYLIQYKKADKDPQELMKFLEGIGAEPTPRLFGVPIP